MRKWGDKPIPEHQNLLATLAWVLLPNRHSRSNRAELGDLHPCLNLMFPWVATSYLSIKNKNLNMDLHFKLSLWGVVYGFIKGNEDFSQIKNLRENVKCENFSRTMCLLYLVCYRWGTGEGVRSETWTDYGQWVLSLLWVWIWLLPGWILSPLPAFSTSNFSPFTNPNS